MYPSDPTHGNFCLFVLLAAFAIQIIALNFNKGGWYEK